MRQGFFWIQIPGNHPLHLLAGESSRVENIQVTRVQNTNLETTETPSRGLTFPTSALRKQAPYAWRHMLTKQPSQEYSLRGFGAQASTPEYLKPNHAMETRALLICS